MRRPYPHGRDRWTELVATGVVVDPMGFHVLGLSTGEVDKIGEARCANLAPGLVLPPICTHPQRLSPVLSMNPQRTTIVRPAHKWWTGPELNQYFCGQGYRAFDEMFGDGY